MHKRILVAVDGSPTSEAALAEAVAAAAGSDATLRLVHVVDSPYSYPDVLYGQVAADLDGVRRAWRQAGEEILAKAGARAREAGVAVEPALLESDGRRV
ncbi:MAG TPA: universal stress protein, partial [Methylomirabilota bacterium]|nr:universal stress protein [Methylomirabilota bacterium]